MGILGYIKTDNNSLKFLTLFVTVIVKCCKWSWTHGWNTLVK